MTKKKKRIKQVKSKFLKSFDSTFLQRIYIMVNKLTKSVQHHQSWRKCKSKPQWDTTSQPSRQLLWKKGPWRLVWQHTGLPGTAPPRCERPEWRAPRDSAGWGKVTHLWQKRPSVAETRRHLCPPRARREEHRRPPAEASAEVSEAELVGWRAGDAGRRQRWRRPSGRIEN